MEISRFVKLLLKLIKLVVAKDGLDASFDDRHKRVELIISKRLVFHELISFDCVDQTWKERRKKNNSENSHRSNWQVRNVSDETQTFIHMWRSRLLLFIGRKLSPVIRSASNHGIFPLMLCCLQVSSILLLSV